MSTYCFSNLIIYSGKPLLRQEPVFRVSPASPSFIIGWHAFTPGCCQFKKAAVLVSLLATASLFNDSFPLGISCKHKKRPTGETSRSGWLLHRNRGRVVRSLRFAIYTHARTKELGKRREKKVMIHFFLCILKGHNLKSEDRCIQTIAPPPLPHNRHTTGVKNDMHIKFHEDFKGFWLKGIKVQKVQRRVNKKKKKMDDSFRAVG